MNNIKANPIKIVVDADACPVKKEIEKLADKFLLDVTFVASYAQMSMGNTKYNWVYVDNHKESADMYIMNAVQKGDIVVTQDIGLASIIISKSVYCLSHLGKQYTEDMISTALDMRYLSAKARRQGVHSKGPKAFTDKDRIHFYHSLDALLTKITGKHF